VRLYSHPRFERALQLFLGASEEELAVTESGWISLYTHLGPDGGPTILEDWQVLAANNGAPYQYWAKSRQVGFSWIQALQKLARSEIVPRLTGKRYTAVFLSINLEEATNKIRYVMDAWNTLPADLQGGPLKLVSETQKSLEFANGSRLISYPAKAVRGESGADVVLDEAAHLPKAKEIYAGTTAAAIRSSSGSGSIIVGSTPLGESGFFFDLADLDDTGAYPVYQRQRHFVYWWDSVALCTDVPAARKRAVEENWIGNRDYESVRSRVQEFGIPRLNNEFEGHSLEDFLQEYEVAYSTVSGALIPRSDILNAVDPEYGQLARTLTRANSRDVGVLVEEIRQTLKKLIYGRSPYIVAAYDPARKRDQAALAILMKQDGLVHVLVRVSLLDTRYSVQEELLRAIVADERIHKLRIDTTGGMGGPIYEKLSSEWGPARVEEVLFNQGSKHLMASKLAALYSHGKMRHTGDREIIRQVSSVRQIATPSGNMKYEGGGEEHHADVFWALAMAAAEYRMSEGEGGVVVASRRGADGPLDDPRQATRGRGEYREWLKKRRESY